MLIIKQLLYKILLWTNYACAVALLLAYLSVYINPDDIGILALFGLGFAFLLIANFIYVFFWIYKKRFYFLISLVCIFVGWSHLTNFFTINLDKKELCDKNYKILSYNVRLFDLYDWTKKSGTKDKILYFLQDEKPDFICLQEFYSKSKHDENSIGYQIEKKLNLNNHHIEYASKNGKEYNYGLATFSKYQMVDRGVIEFSQSSNFCIFSDIVIHKDTVRIYNTHLESVHLGKEDYRFIDSIEYKLNDKRIHSLFDIFAKLNKAFVKRAQQAETIFLHMQKSPYPVIICGDFNDTPISYSYHRLKSDLTDAFLESGNGMGVTYLRNFFPFRIDYILHSKNIKSSKFITYGEKLSDHHPISTKFCFEKP